MNFPDVESREETDFLPPPQQFIDCNAARQLHRERMNRHAAQIDTWRLDVLRRDHPELVQAERDFYAAKKNNNKASEAGPSTPAPLPPSIVTDSSDSSDLNSNFWDGSSDGSFDFRISV